MRTNNFVRKYFYRDYANRSHTYARVLVRRITVCIASEFEAILLPPAGIAGRRLLAVPPGHECLITT